MRNDTGQAAVEYAMIITVSVALVILIARFGLDLVSTARSIAEGVF